MQTFPIAVIGFALGGTHGLYWGVGIGWTLALIGSWFFDKFLLKKAAELQGQLQRIEDELNRACDIREAAPADEWTLIKQLLSHNQNLTPSNLAGERDAVLWSYRVERRLPVNDIDLLNTCGRYFAATTR